MLYNLVGIALIGGLMYLGRNYIKLARSLIFKSKPNLFITGLVKRHESVIVNSGSGILQLSIPYTKVAGLESIHCFLVFGGSETSLPLLKVGNKIFGTTVKALDCEASGIRVLMDKDGETVEGMIPSNQTIHDYLVSL